MQQTHRTQICNQSDSIYSRYSAKSSALLHKAIGHSFLSRRTKQVCFGTKIDHTEAEQRLNSEHDYTEFRDLRQNEEGNEIQAIDPEIVASYLGLFSNKLC